MPTGGTNTAYLAPISILWRVILMPHKLNYPSIEAIKEFNRIIVSEREETYSLEDPKQLEIILQDTETLAEDLPLENAIIKKATRLLRGITLAQPFYEGNKETALATTRVFLLRNGFKLIASDEEIFDLLTGIISGSQDLNAVESFLSIHVKKA